MGCGPQCLVGDVGRFAHGIRHADFEVGEQRANSGHMVAGRVVVKYVSERACRVAGCSTKEGRIIRRRVPIRTVEGSDGEEGIERMRSRVFHPVFHSVGISGRYDCRRRVRESW